MNAVATAPACAPAPAERVRPIVRPRIISAVTAGVLCAIVAFGAALRLLAYRGYWGTDDGEYALLAHAMATGGFWEFVDLNYVQQFNGPAHLPYRMGLIAPLALLFRVFGVSEHALVAYPLVISVGGVVLAFAAGRHFFGTRAGLLAAALFAVVPVEIDFATSFLPDGIASFYASLGVLTVLAFGSRPGAGPRSLFAAGAGAGLLFGISWLSKESVTYLVPFCAFLIVTGLRADFRRTLPLWAGVALASGGVLLAEMTYYGLTRGDFLLRMHENERSFVQTRAYLFYEGSRFGWPVGASHAKALLKRLFVEGPAVFFLSPSFLFLPLFGLVATARAAFWKDAAFKIPAIWMISLIVMYNFGSPTFESYTPLVLLHRYLVPMLLPAAVLTAGLIVRLLERHCGENEDQRERRFWGLALAVVLIIASAGVTFQEVRDLARTQPMYETRDVARLIPPEDRVYTDPLSRKALQFYWNYPSATEMADFEGMNAAAIAPGSFVLVDRNRLNWLDVNVSMWLTSDHGYHEPEFARLPPESWKVLWRNAYTTLYRAN